MVRNAVITWPRVQGTDAPEQRMRKLARFMEHFWLAVAIGAAIAAAWVIATEGFERGRQWLWLPGIALAAFLARRIMRKKIEAMEGRDKGT